MATTQQYSLRWNNYFRHLTTSLDYLRTNDDFVDVSLFCDGRKIKAHKVVLSSCSGYFKEIFKENPHPHPVIIFKFIKFEDLNSIIQFMYQGEVNVQQDALQSFLQTAELLAVQGLTAEEKDKKTSLAPLIEEQKLNKSIPSTIRPLHEESSLNPSVAALAAATSTTTQTIEIPTSTLLQSNNIQQQLQQHQHKQQQTQIQHIQIQHTSTPAPQQQQQQQQIHHHAVHTQQIPQQQQSAQQVQTTQQQQQLQPQQIQLSNVANIGNTSSVTIPVNAVQQQQHQQQHHTNVQKKRKLTFSDDDNIYTTDAVDESTLVKIKMDMPGYIISEVDESQHLSDSSDHANTQDNPNTAGGNVTQYPSEYEILTESEVEEKFNQNDSEISIEMTRLLSRSVTANTQDTLDDVGNTVSIRGEGKNSNTTGLSKGILIYH